MTNVPTPTLGTAGFVAPAESVILAGVLADMSAAFGGNLNPALETPQGQMATAIAAVLGYGNDLFAYYVSQVDPAFAQGRMQDGIARIYFLERLPSEPTSVLCTCAGLAGTVIPAGALAVATDGTKYACVGGGTIPAAATINLEFAAVVNGPTECPATSLNTIYQTVPGWDSITNPADGIPGRATETRADFETRRNASVALNSLGMLPSIRAAVLNVPNVLDAYVTENPTAAPVTIGGVTLAAHSLWVASSGGDPQAIATAIWSKKPPGCAYNGNTTRSVVDLNSGYLPPYPTYSVTFQTATPLQVAMLVQIANSVNVPANAAALVQDVVAAAFTGADGGKRAKIGALLLASRFYAGIAVLGDWAQVISVTLGSANAPAATMTASIDDGSGGAGSTLTVTTISGALVVGQTISGPGVLPGTRILAFASGAGGVGTYTVNQAQVVAGEALAAFTPTLNDVAVRIDQVPTLALSDVAVTLV